MQSLQTEMKTPGMRSHVILAVFLAAVAMGSPPCHEGVHHIILTQGQPPDVHATPHAQTPQIPAAALLKSDTDSGVPSSLNVSMATPPATELEAAAPVQSGSASDLPSITTAATNSTGDDDNLISDFLASKIESRTGLALPCIKNAACDPRFANPAAATVLLMLASAQGGRFCTGTFIRGPDPTDQLIITANHCRGDDDDATIANLWGVVFQHDAPSCEQTTSGGHAASAALVPGAKQPSARTRTTTAPPRPPLLPAIPVVASQVLQGLEVAWSNEIADVLLLRLTNQIPSQYAPFLLGWDATGGTLAPGGSGTVHHDAGDVKKLTETTLPLRWATWRRADYATHYLAKWTDGVTEMGSSGASLVDADTGLALGVLTGGATPDRCEGGADLFGSLAAAWDAGLWEVLSPQGPDAVQRMQGVQYTATAPGLIVNPSQLVLKERPDARVVMHVKLSSAPVEGEVIAVNVSAQQQVGSGEAPVVVLTPILNFSSVDWNTSQEVEIVPGDDAMVTGPLPFTLLMDLSSSMRPEVHSQRIVRGLRSDEEAPTGLTPADPVLVRSGPRGIQIASAGVLLGADVDAQRQSEVHVGDPLPPEGGGLIGATAYYNVTPGQSVTLNIAACSADAPLQVAVYNASVATWVSTQDCVTADMPDCEAVDDVSGCSGFLRLELPGLGTLPPYTIAMRSKGSPRPVRYQLDVVETSPEHSLFGSAGGEGGGG